jgi:RNA polymerase sigma factor (TIGR02999 family)
VEQPTQVTVLIDAAAAGDPLATQRLFPLVYAELRSIAGSLMNGQPGQTLQPTALVNEAYMRLVGSGERGWDSRAHFFGAAARAMRQILIDHARRVQTARRALEHPALLPTLDSHAPQDRAIEEMLALDHAMQRLAQHDERQHEVVMLRFFAGLTIEQTAQALSLSPATVKNEWNYAKAWLMREIDRTGAREPR